LTAENLVGRIFLLKGPFLFDSFPDQETTYLDHIAPDSTHREIGGSDGIRQKPMLVFGISWHLLLFEFLQDSKLDLPILV